VLRSCPVACLFSSHPHFFDKWCNMLQQLADWSSQGTGTVLPVTGTTAWRIPCQCSRSNCSHVPSDGTHCDDFYCSPVLSSHWCWSQSLCRLSRNSLLTNFGCFHGIFVCVLVLPHSCRREAVSWNFPIHCSLSIYCLSLKLYTPPNLIVGNRLVQSVFVVSH
jgi:hypothetical protein